MLSIAILLSCPVRQDLSLQLNSAQPSVSVLPLSRGCKGCRTSLGPAPGNAEAFRGNESNRRMQKPQPTCLDPGSWVLISSGHGNDTAMGKCLGNLQQFYCLHIRPAQSHLTNAGDVPAADE